MSWSKRAFVPVAAALALGALAACGFQPLHARGGADGASADLAAIQIEPIKDRVGQMMHNRLRDALNPNGLPAKPRYYLKVTLAEISQETVVQRTAFAARANLTLTATYSLHDAVTRAAIHSGSVKSLSSYSHQTAPLGTLAGEKDARERAVTDAAEEIRTRLALYFKSIAPDTKRD